jgi:lipoyl(octanoyl) transferase
VEALSCRLLPWKIADGPTNMAGDEVLVRTAAEHGIASLRFYGWSQATLSLGYFQPASVRLSDPRLAALPFVRRPSGGGAIVHHHEVTYALAVPPGKEWHAGGPWMPRMHRVIAQALAESGIGDRLTAVTELNAVKHGAVLCFQQLTPGDLICGASKVVGSAQRKYCRALLQHGSILVKHSEHAPALSGLEELTDLPWSERRMWREVAYHFRIATNWKITPAAWTDDERIAIAALVREKYGTSAWNERR